MSNGLPLRQSSIKPKRVRSAAQGQGRRLPDDCGTVVAPKHTRGTQHGRKTKTMNLQSDERILRQARIHPGIFGLPVLLLVVLMLPTIPLLFFFNMMGNMMSQFSPQGAGFHLLILWLLIIGMDLFPALFVFLLVLVAYLNCEVTLTNKRLVYRTGFLARAAGELALENVEAMFILEPLLGRLLGYGTVAVSTIGGLQFPLRFIGKPHVFHAALQRAVADAKAPSRPPPKAPSQPLGDSRYMPRA